MFFNNATEVAERSAIHGGIQFSVSLSIVLIKYFWTESAPCLFSSC